MTDGNEIVAAGGWGVPGFNPFTTLGLSGEQVEALRQSATPASHEPDPLADMVNALLTRGYLVRKVGLRWHVLRRTVIVSGVVGNQIERGHSYTVKVAAYWRKSRATRAAATLNRYDPLCRKA